MGVIQSLQANTLPFPNLEVALIPRRPPGKAITVWTPCRTLKWWFGHREETPSCDALLTHLAPQDSAFDCSKPQIAGAGDSSRVPPLCEADSYYRYLNSALADPHVYNIALAGHFGSGKSTILRTYERHYAPKRRFLCISLATFGEAPQESDAKDPRRLNHLVEHSILQQLFYQVPKSQIPRSRFKRIVKLGTTWPWIIFAVWLASVGCAVALLRPDVFANARILHRIITATTEPVNSLLTIGALFAFALPAVIVFKKLRSVTMRKLNLKSCEIEISEEKDPSALNKHLDEILYFFEATDFDVVILEDLDRFRTTDVFTKLREINTLVNRNIQAQGRSRWRCLGRTTRRVVFIYAIRDDMFTGEERTKFFDLVIPVIPVVNHINSRELLTQALRSRGFTDIGDELINDVAIFVRDMRLLHNVVNEYTVYRSRLNMKGLDPQKLFGIILYKNVCPDDFAKLHNSSGKLHECIGRRGLLLDETTESMRTDQERLKLKIADAEKQRPMSVRELRVLYVLEAVNQVQKSANFASSIRLGRTYYPFGSLVDDEPFSLLVQTNGDSQDRQGYTFPFSFVKVEKAVDPKRTYAEREDLILSREGKRQEQLERELEQLDERIRELRHAKLQELLRVSGAEALPRDIPAVIAVMLRKGYIDETYLSYLSYFYEGSLSNSDWVFVQGVKTGQAFDPDYTLDNVNEIVGRNLGSDEAVSLAGCNIHLLHYFAAKGGDVFGSVVTQLQRDAGASVELVTLYLERRDSESSALIPVLYECWPDFWAAVMEHEELSATEWKRHVRALVSHVTPKQLKVVCERTRLSEDIAGDERFLPLAESLPDVDRVIAFLGTVRPCFRELPELDSTSAIARFIYDHGLYEVTAHNVILVHKLFVGPLPEALPPSITHLRGQSNCPLTKRTEEHIQQYVGILIGIDGALRRESEPTVVSLLNDEHLSPETIDTLAGGRCVPIERIETIESTELWSLLLGKRSAMPTWDNVLSYHEECANEELDDVLIDYLSDEAVAAGLSKRREVALFTDRERTGLKIMAQILACDTIPTSCVARFLGALPKGASFADASTIASSHLAEAHPWIDFSAGNYKYIHALAAPSLGEYVKVHLEDFYSLISELSISGEELAIILDAQRNNRKKREIVSAVFAHSVPDDLAPVAGQLCDLMLAEERFAEGFAPDALTEIIRSVRDRSTKTRALNRLMGYLTDGGIWDVLRSAGDPYQEIAIPGKRPRIPDGKVNTELARALQERGLISSFKIEDDGVRIETFRPQR